MSTHDEPDNGNGRATVALVNAKVDGIKDLLKAEFEAVGKRLDDLAGLEPRIRALEQTAIGQLQPLEEGVRQVNSRVDELATAVETLTNQSVTKDQVRTAVAFDRNERDQRSSAAFTQREKVIGMVFAGLLVLLNFYEVFHSLSN